ncbi:cystathionine gamma-synthase [Actinobacteria bacterium YIM 96077]|uniref:homocysteine desulfhydrase n=1 Tax=Phytoactinopolyspora halophila TaxID=1981511 RepID=A0A329R5N3_9ACTN|nr:PLP-dependent transferase [Phytoactinopolyspora halophila]AYY12024.1 cystathionine gamma-synthase [Actinobacteria bacterium YIM 96077]RAW18742.1 cystathionine gamma-synthase [Phytoactinopolyspora halophila]
MSTFQNSRNPDAHSPGTRCGGLSPQSRLVAGGRPEPVADAPLNEPVTLASTYHAGGERGYGRYGNPTWEAFEDVLGDLEGGSALAFASGMAASTAVLELLPAGAVVVAPDCAYLGVLEQMRERHEARRIELRQVDVSDTPAVRAALAGASMVWLESPTNPKLDIADVAAIGAAAHEAGALTVVDNTFATPLLQQPLQLGADVVVHSVTKLLSGHSDVVAGATVTSDDGVSARLDRHRRLHGATPSPMDTYLALRGMRTLGVRLDRAQANAAELTRRLSEHPAVTRVRYPGWGSICSIEVVGGAPGADAVVDAVQLWVNTTSLGGVESTLERRRRWPAESHTVDESLIRLSVGIEDPDDLWQDLSRALDAARRH